jgi:thiamine transporter
LENNWVSLDVIPYVFIPVLTTLCIALILGVIYFALAKKGFAKLKIYRTVSAIIVAIAIIATLVLMGVYYGKNVADDGYYSEHLNNVALYVFAGAVIIFTVATAFIVGAKDKKPFDTKCVSMAGICVALSFCLSYIKLWDMPTGGSVTLVSLLPVMLFSYIYGIKKGLLIGLLYGTLQAVQDPWLIHPAQFILDYPIAFSAVCFAGVLKDVKALDKLPQLKFGISAFIAGSVRFLCHVLSGVFAFGAYAVDAGATNFWTYSLVYNAYVFVDVALVIIAGIFLLSSKTMVKQLQAKNSTDVQ